MNNTYESNKLSEQYIYNERKIKKNTENNKKILCLSIGIAILLALIIVSIRQGSLDVSYKELIVGIITNNSDGNMGIIRDLRMPRILIAVIVGANLAIAGVLLQAVMKNPLADPGITGISSGASLIAITVMIFLPQLNNIKPILAVGGGLVAATLVYSIAYNKGFEPIRLVLAGVAINAMLGSMSSILTMFNSSGVNSIQMWLNGSLSTVSWIDVKLITIYSSIGIVGSIFLSKVCNLMVLGDKTAKSLGIDTNKQRIIISAVAVFLASISTGIVGVISFVGLIVPHIARFIIGSDHKYLIPFSGISGGILLLIADTVGRTIMKPYEIPVGLVMSVIGAPFFIYLLRRSDKK